MGLAHWSLVTPCQSFFFSLSPSLSFSGWSLGAQRLSAFTFLPGLLRPDGEGTLCLQSGKRAPVASVNRASPLSWGFIGFLCKQRNISFYPFLSHSFIHSFANTVTLRIPWIQPGQDPGIYPWVLKSSRRREWQPTPVSLPREFQGQGSLADYSPWGHKELDMTERITHTFHRWGAQFHKAAQLQMPAKMGPQVTCPSA